ncbi:MAG: hypothetical protein Q9217_000778 [Psora testacea]
MATKPTTSQRRVLPQDMLQIQPLQVQSPATLSSSAQPASVPTSRLKKRNSYGWPLTSSTNSTDGRRAISSIPDEVVKRVTSNGSGKDSLRREPGPLGACKSSTFEPKAPENLSPSQQRPMSTMSSLKTGSPINISRPGSPALSHSNGSTAPILRNLGVPNPHTPTRNKLVKRSASQRALHGRSNLHSTLRRPATSHQRSATTQRQNPDGEESIYRRFHSSPLPYGLPEHQQSFDDSAQRWRPFFKSQAIRHRKDGSNRKRSLQAGFARHESPPTIIPDVTELPTLLMATSISTRSSDEAITGRPSNISALSRPLTPFGMGSFDMRMQKTGEAEPTIDSDIRPRTSISISDIFPSPSRSTWKTPRAGILGKKRTFGRTAGGRRAVSAPQSAQAPIITGSAQDNRVLGNNTRIYASPDNDQTPSKMQLAQNSVFQRSPSSPLPSLDRFSAFEIDLPKRVPSYSTSPQPEEPTNTCQDLSRPSSSPSSPLELSLQRNQAHRPSGTNSDHASTLLGSDNENSRSFSGNEDDMDGRSETLYDSARTGATGSSLSRNKRPHIDTIFDESPPPELPSEDRLLALENRRTVNAVTADNVGKHHVPEQNDSSLTAEPTFPCKEQEHRIFSQGADKTSHMPESDILPPVTSSDLEIAITQNSQPVDSQSEELWASYDVEKLPNDPITSHKSTVSNMNELPVEEPSRARKTTPKRRESPPPNPFEWSEQSAMEKDSPQGDSPRPKTVHGRQGKDLRGSRLSGRRGPPALHLRSQSVPVPNESRSHSSTSKLDSWVLGNKGPSEEWDGDFDFEEVPRTPKPVNDGMRPSVSSGMLVPRAILERQASVHGQFGQVKELTKLVEELKRLQHQARLQGIMNGQSAELWKEAEGIINLATLDDEEPELFPPHSPIADFDFFDEDSPSHRRRRSGPTPPIDERFSTAGDHSSQTSPRPSYDRSNVEAKPSTARPRKESSAKAKSVLENIHQQRAHYDPALLDAKMTQKKLPFDTTSLKDLVTRAGVVTRALKEEIRRAENRSESLATTPDHRPDTPPDPPFSQMFQKPPPSPSVGKNSRDSKSTCVTQSPKSPKSPRGSMLGGSIAGNDNDFNGHMKMMTVV